MGGYGSDLGRRGFIGAVSAVAVHPLFTAAAAADDAVIQLETDGDQAWVVLSDSEDNTATEVQNPTLALETGLRYRFEDTGGADHPFQVLDENGAVLLSQDEEGGFEDDEDVDWSDGTTYFEFTVTGELAEHLKFYHCTRHSGMYGEIATAEEYDGDEDDYEEPDGSTEDDEDEDYEETEDEETEEPDPPAETDDGGDEEDDRVETDEEHEEDDGTGADEKRDEEEEAAQHEDGAADEDGSDDDGGGEDQVTGFERDADDHGDAESDEDADESGHDQRDEAAPGFTAVAGAAASTAVAAGYALRRRLTRDGGSG